MNLWKAIKLPKYSISINGLNQTYMSYLLPVVEYASVVWDGYSEQDPQTL